MFTMSPQKAKASGRRFLAQALVEILALQQRSVGGVLRQGLLTEGNKKVYGTEGVRVTETYIAGLLKEDGIEKIPQEIKQEIEKGVQNALAVAKKVDAMKPVENPPELLEMTDLFEKEPAAPVNGTRADPRKIAETFLQGFEKLQEIDPRKTDPRCLMQYAKRLFEKAEVPIDNALKKRIERAGEHAKQLIAARAKAPKP